MNHTRSRTRIIKRVRKKFQFTFDIFLLLAAVGTCCLSDSYPPFTVFTLVLSLWFLRTRMRDLVTQMMMKKVVNMIVVTEIMMMFLLIKKNMVIMMMYI